MFKSFRFIIPAFFICVLFIFYVLGKTKFSFFFFFFVFFSAIFLFFRQLRRNFFYKLHGELDRMDEKINLLTKSIEEKKRILDKLPSRCEKISFLFDVSQELIELFDPEEVYDFLVNTAKKLFSQAEDILLFVLPKDEHFLHLVRSLKRDNFVIKEKQGDILDAWVMRHNQSLLVSDLRDDFRFDYGKVVSFMEREMCSFVVSPLSVGKRIVGIMRLENRVPLTFSLEDSRLLRGICDLAAVVVERAVLYKKTEELAVRDSLTKLFLKDYFFDRFSEELKRAQLKDLSVGLIMLDIDDFKKINDRHGHVVGDLALKKLAKILVEVVGDAGNVISRFGGEEFIIFLVECGKDRLLKIAEEIRERTEKTVVNFRRQKITFTVSIGGTFYPQDSKDITELMATVDRRLYKAKREGKNRICIDP